MALEAYGAANTLQEILTVKSDDTVGRVKTYEAIIKGQNIPTPGVPESFKVLLKEMQALSLDVRVLDAQKNEIIIPELDPEDMAQPEPPIRPAVTAPSAEEVSEAQEEGLDEEAADEAFSMSEEDLDFGKTLDDEGADEFAIDDKDMEDLEDFNVDDLSDLNLDEDL